MSRNTGIHLASYTFNMASNEPMESFNIRIGMNMTEPECRCRYCWPVVAVLDKVSISSTNDASCAAMQHNIEVNGICVGGL
ncbi:hypothetical protein BLOT_015400 [Blomia tropicalis]|nr:hypothetical protein BLOT_015400 [Blomia tropicalis]